MGYDPNIWAPGDLLTAPKLNRLEAAAAASNLRGDTIMVMGDSLGAPVSPYDPNTNSSTLVNMTGEADWLEMANWSAGSPLKVLGSAATGGYTAQQIRDVHLPTVLAAKPTYVICATMAGNNALATGEFPEADLDVANDILDRLIAEGITPIMVTLPPIARVGSTFSPAEFERYQTWVVRTSQRRGLPLIDLTTPFASKTTGDGGYAAGLSDDLIHPNATGYALFIEQVAKLLRKLDRFGPRAGISSFFNVLSGDASGALLPWCSPNPYMTGTSGEGGSPAGCQFYHNGDGVLSKGARSDGAPGERVTITGGAPALSSFYLPPLPVSPGERFSLDIRLGITVPAGGEASLSLVNQAGQDAAWYQPALKFNVPDVQPLTVIGTARPGWTKAILCVTVRGAATAARIEGPSLRNLTRMPIPTEEK